ncbi:MAG: ABC transporter substrate-binding protein, partial [Dialister sp.]
MKNWKKKVLAGLAVLALAGAAAGISGCGGGKQEAQSASAVRTITDIKGNQVTLPEKVSKIAVTPIPWASIVYALDGGSSE